MSLTTAGALIDYVVICLTYLNFYYACKAQGVDRKTLPYTGYFQPYCAYIGIVFEFLICLFYGYKIFADLTVEKFFQNYTMQLIAPVAFIFWKFFKETKYVKPSELDLEWERPIVDAYEATFVNPPLGFWTEMGQLIGIKRHLRDDERTI